MPARAKVAVGAVIFLVSFAVKSLQAVDIAPLVHTRSQPFNGLTDRYDQHAMTIVEGSGVLMPSAQDPRDTGLLSHAPGYPIYLSLIYARSGRNFFSVQLLQNAINSLSPVLMFLVAGGLLGWRVGVGSGLLSAISHHLSYYSNLILPDSLCALPLLAGVYCLVKAVRVRGSLWLYGLAGGMLGLAAWLRPNSMLIGPFLACFLVLVYRRRRVIAGAAVMAAVSILVIAPITIRNYLIYREFVPIQIGTGLNLWEGIGESSGARFAAVATDQEVAEQDAVLFGDPEYRGWWASPDGIKRDRDRVRRSLSVITSHPLWYAGVMLDRMNEMVKYSAHAPLVFRSTDTRVKEAAQEAVGEGSRRPDPADTAMAAVGRTLLWARPAARVLQRINKETALVFILLGAVILFTLSGRRALLIGMTPLYYLLIQSTMHTEFRYALPMHYFLFVLAAVVWVLLASLTLRGAILIGSRGRPMPD